MREFIVFFFFLFFPCALLSRFVFVFLCVILFLFLCVLSGFQREEHRVAQDNLLLFDVPFATNPFLPLHPLIYMFFIILSSLSWSLFCFVLLFSLLLFSLLLLPIASSLRDDLSSALLCLKHCHQAYRTHVPFRPLPFAPLLCFCFATVISSSLRYVLK